MADEAFLASLGPLVRAMVVARDEWWIIGSAAVALHGGDPGTIADVDVITSRRDLDALHETLPLTDTPESGKPMFASERFGRWSEPELDVEFMTGLKLLERGSWQPIVPRTRCEICFGNLALFVPEKAELIELLRRFGRDKDLRRAATLGG